MSTTFFVFRFFALIVELLLENLNLQVAFEFRDDLFGVLLYSTLKLNLVNSLVAAYESSAESESLYHWTHYSGSHHCVE